MEVVLAGVALAAYVGLLAWAAVNDARTYIIPNRIVIALLVAFVVTGPPLLPLVALPWHLASAALVLAVGLALFRFGLMGGGDVKLFAGAALWVGFDLLPLFLLAVVVMGGVLSVVLLLLRSRALVLAWLEPLLLRLGGLPLLFQKGQPVPYGIAIAAGALVIVSRMAIFAPVF